MTSAASRTIIDQEWITVVNVAPAAPVATAPAQLQLPAIVAPAPDRGNERLFRADVMVEAYRRGYPRPYYLTLEERRVIAEQLDLKRDQQRAAILHKCGHVNLREPAPYSESGIYGSVGTCTPSRGDTLTGRG